VLAELISIAQVSIVTAGPRSPAVFRSGARSLASVRHGSATFDPACPRQMTAAD
jgi:hypothetical protein